MKKSKTFSVKALTITLGLLSLSTTLTAQSVNIPDANFKAKLLAHSPVIDSNGDGDISVLEASTYRGAMKLANSNISDLTGIEAFVNISYLKVENNQLTSLDISNNTSLRMIACNNNQLTSLDLSSQSSLGMLLCNDNNLTHLNIANGNNAYTDLMDARNNNLNCIQHDPNFNASYYETHYQNWKKDTTASWSSNCPTSSCSQIVNIPDANFKAKLLAHGYTFNGSGISIIDTDGDGEICKSEAQAYGREINISFDNVSDLTGIEAFVNLKKLKCRNNQITTLDITNNTALKVLNISNNQITTLDVTNNPALKKLFSQGNQLTALDITNNPVLKILNISRNQLTSLDISNSSVLTKIHCKNNQLTSLNLANGNNINMSHMVAENNPQLTCIQHDTGFVPSTNTNWDKDATASWSSNCNNNGPLFYRQVNNSDFIDVNIYPNPATNFVTVELLGNLTAEKIEVFDLSGKRVLYQKINKKENLINVANLTGGNYIVKIGEISKQLVIK